MKLRHLFIIRTVAVKELKDFFRDPRSIILSLLLPLLLFPLLFWVLTQDKETSFNQDKIFNFAIEKKLESSSLNFHSSKIESSFFDKEYPQDWQNDYDALVMKEPETGIPLVLYDNSNPDSITAFQIFKSLNSIVSEPPVTEQDEEKNVTVEGRPLYPEEEAAGKMFLATLLPFVFFIFSITCPLPGAADLSSGEKERGSLEPLLSTAAPRTDIVLGKFISASITGTCSVCAYFLGIYISFLITPEIIGDVPMSFPLSYLQIGLLPLLLIIMTSLFSAIEICIGFMTRSVREAQLISMPLLMVGMGAVYTAQNLNLAQKPWFMTHIPLVNIALVIRETALNRIIISDIFTVLIWTLIYFMLITFTAISMFQNESTLFKK